MIKNLILAALTILLAIIVTFGLEHYFKNNRGDFFVLEKGQAVPNFSFQTIDGHDYQLDEFSDKIILIHFWATWCAPCVVEFPELIKLAKKRDDVVIIALSSDRTMDSINRFIKKDLPDNFKIIHDQNQNITRDKFNVFRLPETYILDKDLILQNHIIGAYADWKNL